MFKVESTGGLGTKFGGFSVKSWQQCGARCEGDLDEGLMVIDTAGKIMFGDDVGIKGAIHMFS